jgi:GNAT superfamily N-acetyltransferase
VRAAARTKRTTDSARAESIAWHHAQHALVCDELEPWRYGTVVRTPSSPDYWDYNVVRVEGPDPGLGAGELIVEVDRLQANLRHRKLEVEDEGAGARLRDAFALAGWSHERLAHMRRTGPPPAPDPAVAEVHLADTRALRVEWFSDLDWAGDAVERFVVAQEPVLELRGGRAFVVLEDGVAIGFTTVSAPDGMTAAEIDQLYVTPSHRGAGVGRALVHSALAAVDRDPAWIVADDEDRPKQLYERLGFTPVWRLHGFLRRPQD